MLGEENVGVSIFSRGRACLRTDGPQDASTLHQALSDWCAGGRARGRATYRAGASFQLPACLEGRRRGEERFRHRSFLSPRSLCDRTSIRAGFQGDGPKELGTEQMCTTSPSPSFPSKWAGGGRCGVGARFLPPKGIFYCVAFLQKISGRMSQMPGGAQGSTLSTAGSAPALLRMSGSTITNLTSH